MRSRDRASVKRLGSSRVRARRLRELGSSSSENEDLGLKALQRARPGRVHARIFAFLFWRIPCAASRATLPGEWGRYLVSCSRTLSSTSVDTFVQQARVVVNVPCVPGRSPVRATTSSSSLVNTQLGQGGIALYLHGVGSILGDTGTVIFISFVEVTSRLLLCVGAAAGGELGGSHASGLRRARRLTSPCTSGTSRARVQAGSAGRAPHRLPARPPVHYLRLLSTDAELLAASRALARAALFGMHVPFLTLLTSSHHLLLRRASGRGSAPRASQLAWSTSSAAPSEGGAPRYRPGRAFDFGGHERGDRPRLSPRARELAMA